MGIALREAKAWLLIGMLALAGCEGPARPAHDTALEDYTCTVEQMGRVQKETAFCKTTGYFGTYCYGTAIIRNCTKRVRLLPEGE